VEKKRTIAVPVYKSRTIAREITIPAAPAAPWISRQASEAIA
jgi:hypothetical protein